VKPVSLVPPVSAIILVGCVGAGQLLETRIAVDHLDGNYIRLASCTLEQLARRQPRLDLKDVREKNIVRIVRTSGTAAHWKLSFVDEDEGRQTRLEVTSVNGSSPGEHVLASARAPARNLASQHGGVDQRSVKPLSIHRLVQKVV
jgi:hypothetical protein